jgi:hypothetical protein
MKAPVESPSPAPPARSATPSSSALPPAPCSARPAGDPAAAGHHACHGCPRGRAHGTRRLRLPAAGRHRLHRRPGRGFKDADYALLVGARPRGPGMERKDLLEANAAIFSVQGKAINDHASRDIKVLVVGNPANTNALITQRNAPDIDPRNFTAMMRLDHNRAMTQIAQKPAQPVTDVSNMTVWGNHSATQYPDLFHARSTGRWPSSRSTRSWYEDDLHPHGAAARRRHHQGPRRLLRGLRRQRRHRSHARLGAGHPADDWVSMGVYSDGSYGIAEGLIYSFPCRCSGGEWEHRAGPGSQRLQPRTHARHGAGTDRRARRRRHLLP